MLFLIALILAFGFTFLCGKPLKKHSCIFYTLAVIITVASVIMTRSDLRSLPVFLNTYVIGLFTRGAFATALWCVVMWVGAFPNGSLPIKKIMPIRGELSIFAAILTLGHNIGFGQTYLVRLFTDSGRMASNYITASILTIAMLVIMIPLTVMSFPKVRKKMNAKLWKKIQRTAYVFYAMIYIHVLCLYYPMAKAGREGIFFNILIYSVVFIGYAVCRIRKYIVVKMKPKNKTFLNIISAVVFSGVLSCVLVSCGKDEKPSSDTGSIISKVTTSVSSESEETSETTSSVSTSAQTTVSTQTTSETDTTTTETTTGTETATEPETEEPTEETEENIDEEHEEYYEENDDYYEEDNNYQDNNDNSNNNNNNYNNQPEPSYIYRNGTYSSSAYGYDGDIFVEITVENDVITSIKAHTEESDEWYFNSAQESVISQILSSQNTDVDAVSGATYSSKAIMEAVQKALNSAKN